MAWQTARVQPFLIGFGGLIRHSDFVILCQPRLTINPWRKNPKMGLQNCE
jgi:hypothetical protein